MSSKPLQTFNFMLKLLNNINGETNINSETRKGNSFICPILMGNSN